MYRLIVILLQLQIIADGFDQAFFHDAEYEETQGSHPSTDYTDGTQTRINE